MLKINVGEFVVFYHEGKDPTEDFVAQYHPASNTMMNHWGTIRITIDPKCSNLSQVAEKLEAFEKTILDDLA